MKVVSHQAYTDMNTDEPSQCNVDARKDYWVNWLMDWESLSLCSHIKHVVMPTVGLSSDHHMTMDTTTWSDALLHQHWARDLLTVGKLQLQVELARTWQRHEWFHHQVHHFSMKRYYPLAHLHVSWFYTHWTTYLAWNCWDSLRQDMTCLLQRQQNYMIYYMASFAANTCSCRC